MHKIESKEYKSKILNMLILFAHYCDQYNLKYSLSGGTLLGAIRHKGFIPWDDDIDVCMPRTDYERFIHADHTVFHKQKLEVKSGTMTSGFYYPFCKIVDLKSRVISANNTQDNQLWIDIFPVDGLPDDIEETVDIYIKISKIRKILMKTHMPLIKVSASGRKIPKISRIYKRTLARIYGAPRCMKKIETIAALHPYDECNYVGAVTWGLYGVGEKMEKAEFEKFINIEFEGNIFKAFSCWNFYLTGLYGNYMELPPERDRHNHKLNVWYKE